MRRLILREFGGPKAIVFEFEHQKIDFEGQTFDLGGHKTNLGAKGSEVKHDFSCWAQPTGARATYKQRLT